MTGLLTGPPDVVLTPAPVRPRVPESVPLWRRKLPVHWPLTVTLIGFPLWWALGLSVIVPMAMSLVMLGQLLRRRHLVLPRGFALWLLFTAWLLLGVFVLFVDAPGAQPGGGPARLLVFAFRVTWYLVATIALVWVTNLRQGDLTSAWLHRMLGYLFVVTATGGMLGVLVPHLQWTSPAEMLVPHGLRSNALISSIVHPMFADIQSVLGTPQARPKAPFPYANTWGSALSLTMPFFVMSAFKRGRPWRCAGAAVVLVVSAIPIMYSLNRGLWISLVVGGLIAMGLLVRRARATTTMAVSALLGLVVVAFLLSPLFTILQERLQHGHSNERRGDLTSLTVRSTAEGSPIVGYGGTRDLEGNFASIAGAARPDCVACGVPPLGTQGHLWNVLFSQGFVGVALFVGFFALALSRCWRCRTLEESLCFFVLVFFGIQLLVYDTLGVPLMIVMLAIGAVAREQLATPRAQSGRLIAPAWARLRAWLPYLLVLMLVGAALGSFLGAREKVEYRSEVSILLAQPPVYLKSDSTATASPQSMSTPEASFTVASSPGQVTIDTEAALVVSRSSLTSALQNTDPRALERLSDHIKVSAEPNTSVLVIQLSDHDPARSARLAARVATSYLVTRGSYLSGRRDQALDLLREQLAATANGDDDAEQSLRNRLEQEVNVILLTPTTAGQVIKTSPPVEVRRQIELPATSGAALGLLAGAAIMAAFPAWWPRRSRRHRVH